MERLKLDCQYLIIFDRFTFGSFVGGLCAGNTGDQTWQQISGCALYVLTLEYLNATYVEMAVMVVEFENALCVSKIFHKGSFFVSIEQSDHLIQMQ